MRPSNWATNVVGQEGGENVYHRDGNDRNDDDDDDDGGGGSALPSWLRDLTRQKSESEQEERTK